MKTGLGLRWKAKAISNLANIPFQMGKGKIFCISMQRNGTTSVGDFLADHGYRVARWGDSRSNRWTYKWHIGDYESIFKSLAFRSFQAFEDDPWWMPDFYRVLNHRFPNAKFILFYRDPDKWFDSMKKHSQGKTLGNTYRHCRVYRRMTEYYEKIDSDPNFCPALNDEIDNLLTLDESIREHYKKIYFEYNREAIEFFKKHGPEKLFHARLEDESKWKDLGDFLGIKVKSDYNVHSNRSL
jgi:hypothetical protein